MRKALDELVVDWSEFEETGRVTRGFLEELARDKQTLRSLVLAVEQQPELLAMCERHQLLDYLVLHDALGRGFRLRVHLSTEHHFERPHDHRFSFTSRILCGRYEHTQYRVEREIYDGRDERAKAWLDRYRPDPESDLGHHDMVPVSTRSECQDDTYTMHHTTVHTTYTTPGTVSLFLRGPAEKARSLIYDRETRKLWWRFGQQEEPAWRRDDKRMSREDYRAFVARLESLGVI